MSHTANLYNSRALTLEHSKQNANAYVPPDTHPFSINPQTKVWHS